MSDELILSNLLHFIVNNRVRVKYLDQEDIEDLGFISYSSDINFKHIAEYRGLVDQKIMIVRRQTILICIGDYKESNDNYDNYKTIFTGYIKNKSELIKLLKQLDI